MTSEIRANTLKNRVGLGTVEYTNTGIIVSGIVTANSFSGPLITTSIDLNGDLDVDGHTNLDNVSIAGVVTATSFVGNLTGTASGNPTLTNGVDNRVITAASANTLNGEATLTYDGTYLDIGGGVTRFTKQGSYNALEIGHGQNGNQNAFIDLIGDTTYTDYGTRIIRNGQNGANAQTDILHRGTGSLNLQTSDAAAIAFKTNGNNEKLRITSDGKVLMDNTTGTFTIGGDNVYDSAKINLMIGSTSQTSATTEATAIVIHDQNSRRNGTEGAGSWKSKIVFRSTQINGNYQSEGASIVHDITYNNYSSTKMRSDLVFKTRGDAQTAASDAATEKLRINHSGKVIIGASSVSPATSFTDNLVVSEATANAGIQIVGNNSNSNYATLGLGDAGGNLRSYLEAQLGANGNFTIGTAGSGPIRFVNSNGQQARITTNLVEATSTFGIANVGGSIGGSGGTENWIGIKDSGGNYKFVVKTHSASSGNFGKVGINNTNPTHPLHIVNTSSTFNSASLIRGDTSTSGGGAYATFTNTADSKSAYFGLDGNGLFNLDAGAALIGTNGSESIIFATDGNSEKVRINSSGNNGLLRIADNNTSSAGNLGFRFGSYGIQMRDTGGYNHWYIRRNYGGWQSNPQITLKASGYTGVNRLDPEWYLDVDGTSMFRDRLYVGTTHIKGVPFGANVTYDTGISVNGGGYGGSMLALCSRNYGAGQGTQAALYFLHFYYDGNHQPAKHYLGGASDFVTFGKSASNTLTVLMGASNNYISMFGSSI